MIEMTRRIRLRLIGGVTLFLCSLALGALARNDRASFARATFDVLGVVAWALLLAGVLACVLALIDYSAERHREPRPLLVVRLGPNSQQIQSSVWSRGFWTLVAAVMTVVTLATFVGMAGETAKRIEGDAKPTWALYGCSLMVLAAFALLTVLAFRTVRQQRAITQALNDDRKQPQSE
jgi:cytochrome bd-type quinol oxidase subunit 2